jgi:hypothetical protein
VGIGFVGGQKPFAYRIPPEDVNRNPDERQKGTNRRNQSRFGHGRDSLSFLSNPNASEKKFDKTKTW